MQPLSDPAEIRKKARSIWADDSDPCMTPLHFFVHIYLLTSVKMVLPWTSPNPRKDKYRRRKGVKWTFYIRKCEILPNQMLPGWKLCHPYALCYRPSVPWKPEWTLARSSAGFPLPHTQAMYMSTHTRGGHLISVCDGYRKGRCLSPGLSVRLHGKQGLWRWGPEKWRHLSKATEEVCSRTGTRLSHYALKEWAHSHVSMIFRGAGWLPEGHRANLAVTIKMQSEWS